MSEPMEDVNAKAVAILRQGRCPFCGAHDFLAGPRGGSAQNFACAHCGAEFNDMSPLGFQLLSKPKGNTQ